MAKRPVGRPTKYDKAMLKTLEGVGDNGESMAETALILKISKDTLYEWIAKYQEFSDAVKASQLRSQKWWEDVAKNQAKEGQGNATSLIFQMKNRFREDYSDTTRHEHTGADGKALFSWPTK
jgi:transposase-like protein